MIHERHGEWTNSVNERSFKIDECKINSKNILFPWNTDQVIGKIVEEKVENFFPE